MRYLKTYKLFEVNEVFGKESIKRVLGEEKLHATPQELIKNLPKELKELLFKQWGAKQNPKWHPEGNTLKHIIVVIKRAYHHYPDDPNMVMAALFHDLGKIDTYKINPKTNQPTAYGHEDKSTDYVEQFKDWILTFEGTDIDEIKYLVKNHMKVKPSTWDEMRDIKKEPISSHPSFNKLMGFTDKLDGGGTDLNEELARIKLENYREYILYRAVGLDEAIKSCDTGHLVYYSREPMSRDWEVIEYGLGDAASEMSDWEVDEYVNNLVPWVSNRKGVNLTSDLDNAKGYSDIVLEINLVGYDYAEFSDVHIFAKNPDDCKIKSVYYNGKEYSKEEFLDGVVTDLNEELTQIKLENYIISGKEFKNKYATDFNGQVAKVFYTQNLDLGSNLGKGSYWNVTQDSLDIYSGERDEELDSKYGEYFKDITYKEIDDNLKIFVKDEISDELWNNEKLYNKIKNISNGIYDPVYDDYGLVLFN